MHDDDRKKMMFMKMMIDALESIAWDQYASAALHSGPHRTSEAATAADAMLAERQKRFAHTATIEAIMAMEDDEDEDEDN